MAKTALKGNPVSTSGELPAVGTQAPALSLVRTNLEEATLATYAGMKKILNIFPSIDTGVCKKSVHTFYQRANELDGVIVLNISADLPFAAKRFCSAEELAIEALSTFRSTFAEDYGVELVDGPMAGLCARAVLVLDGTNTVLHAELVDDIVHEPSYDAALAAL